MKSNLEQYTRKILKSLVKSKKVGFTTALLTVFMITGGLSLASAVPTEDLQTQLVENQTDLMNRVAAQKAELEALLAENEAKLAKLRQNELTTIRKADFYAKPIYPSTQIFLNYGYESSGKMKNNTAANYKSSLDEIREAIEAERIVMNAFESDWNAYYSGKISAEELAKRILEKNSGFATVGQGHSTNVELGVQITPLQPEVPVISKTVSVSVAAPSIPTVSISSPSITAPSLSIMTPSIPSSIPTAPSPTIMLSVTTPAGITPIAITAPTVPAITPPADRNITVNTPAAPDGYTPATIVIPNIPGKNVTVITPPVLPATNVAFMQIPANVTGYNTAGINGGLMSQLELTGGDFRLYFLGGNNYEYSFTGAAASNFAMPDAGTGAISVEAFYRHGGKASTTIPNTVTIDVIGNNTGGALNSVYYLGNNDSASNPESRLTSHATINLYGNKAVIANIDNVSSSGNITFVNQGNITGYAARGTFSPGKEGNVTIGNYIFGGYSYGDGGIDRIENGTNGSVIFYAPSSMGWAYTSGATQNIQRSSVNNGVMKLYGKNSIGVANNANAQAGQIAYADIQLNTPIEILGDESVGIYITREPNTASPNFSNSRYNIKLGGAGTPQDATYGDSKGDVDKVEYAVGLNYDFTLSGSSGMRELKNYRVELSPDVKESIGIRVGNAKMQLNAVNPFSELILKGEKNIGFLVAHSSGELQYNNYNPITIDGENLLLFAATSGGKLQIFNDISLTLNATTDGFSEAYAEGANSLVKFDGGLQTIVNGKDSVLLYAKGNGTIELIESVVTQPLVVPGLPVNGNSAGTPKIDIVGVGGVAYYVATGGQILADNSHIRVTNGITGIYAQDSTSNISIQNSILDYSGNGYALYSKLGGTIDASGSMIILRGSATGLELDLSGSNPLTLTNSTIVMMSDAAVGVNLKNTPPLNISTLEGDIGTHLGGVKILAGTDGSNTFNKYKVAAVDGGILNIDVALDKANPVPTSPGYFYYRRFLGQRLALNVVSGVEVKAEISSTEASAYFNNQVVGLEMSSSSNATSSADAKITLNAGAKVIADRTDAGAGAIGLFMNFGEVYLNTGSTVEVEKGANTVNSKGVGIYAVNGSRVTNFGTLSIAGNQAIGVLGLSYREAPMGTPVVNEFGSTGIFTNQGKITIENNELIRLTGTDTIGIYAYNNNSAGTKSDATVTNTSTGRIEVGNSGSNVAIGIYGEKATIANVGTISVGDSAIGIYAKNGTEVTDLGTLDLGANGIGVMADGSSDISATMVTITSNNSVETSGKIGVYYRGTGAETKTVAAQIDVSAFDKAIAIYAENMNVTSDDILTVGKDGVGIFSKGTAGNTATNIWKINLSPGKTGAVGMYSKTTNLLNDTTGGISVKQASQIGMYAEGFGIKAENKGIIHLDAPGTTGSYIKNGAVVDNSGSISFNSQKSFGIAVDQGTANLGGTSSVTYTLNNDSENIFLYAKSGSTINLAGDVEMNGVALSSSGKKSVGIYLDHTGSINTIDGASNLLTAKNGIVGIYANGNNTVKDITIESLGDGSVGVYYTAAGTLENATLKVDTPSSNAIGVYGNGGDITIIGGLTIELAANSGPYGTGAYLTNNARLTGALVSINNFSMPTWLNVGLYYTKGSGSGTLVHGTDLLIGQNVVGIYADGGIQLSNANTIAFSGGDNVGVYVAGNSKYIAQNMAPIQLLHPNTMGYYVRSGEAINGGPIVVSNPSSVGMVARGTVATDTAKVMNETGSTMTVQSGLGMLIGGYTTPGLGKSEGYNKGLIDVTTGQGVGVVLSGVDDSKFDGTGGTIRVAGTSGAVGIGIYLDSVGAGKLVATGTITLANADSVGIFAKDSWINVGGSGVIIDGHSGIGIFADGTSTLASNVDASASQDNIAVFLNGATGSTVAFSGNKEIKTGNSSGPGNTSIGLLMNNLSTYNLQNVKVSAAAANTIATVLSGGTVGKFSIDISATNGAIGVYVDPISTYDGLGGSLSIGSGSIGVYLDGGTGLFGVNGAMAIHFTGPNAIAVYNANGGSIQLGGLLTTTGAGTLAATQDGDITNSGSISVNNGSTALLGSYSAGGPYEVKNDTTGVITATTGGIGMAAIGSGANVTIKNDGAITVSGKTATNAPGIGMYTNLAVLQNNATITVGSDAIGIYVDNSGNNVISNQLNLTGSGAIGLAVSGTVGSIANGNIQASADRTVGLYLDGVTTSGLTIGTVQLNKGSIGVAIQGGTIAVSGATAVTVGDSVGTNSSVGIYTWGASTSNFGAAPTITVGKGAIAVASKGVGTTINGIDTANLTVGQNGVQLYAENGTINLSGSGAVTANNNIGIMINTGGTVTGLTSLTATNGGIGAFFYSGVATLSSISVTGGSVGKYSIGAYYKDVAIAITLPTITLAGSHVIGAVLEGSMPITLASPIAVGSASDTDQIGLVLQGVGLPLVTLSGVTATGDKNIGIYGENANITSTAITTVGSSSLGDASIGMYAKGSGLNITGPISAGHDTIGVYGEDMALGITAGSITTGVGGIGIYEKNAPTNIQTITTSGNISIAGDKSIGVYGKNTNISMTAPVGTIGAGTSVGIVSEGAGNVSFAGALAIANKGTKTGSIGIYKKGNAGIITVSGTMSVGDGGYGIYVDSGAGSAVTINNGSSMTLGKSAVGIYVNGTNQLNNGGNIIVGETDFGPGGDHSKVDEHQNSVGIYLANGASGNNAAGATITINHGHSVGIYGNGAGTSFINNGIINVSNGGVGIFVRENAQAINRGTITVHGSDIVCEQQSIGMAAYGGAKIINDTTGTIQVTGGAVGMLVGPGAQLVNKGTIIIDATSTGMKGGLDQIDKDSGTVIGGGTEIDFGSGSKIVGDGAVKILPDGTVVIDEHVVMISGNLKASAPLILDGPFVDITNFDPEKPLFTSPDTSGTVHLASNFAQIGNGYVWKIDDFTNALAGVGASKITVVTSPLFMTQVDPKDGSLIVVKDAYSSFVVGEQFKELYDGLDSVLRRDEVGFGASSIVLKNMNSYLDAMYHKLGSDKTEYYRETARVLGEMRGDVYATIQGRMQNIQKSFDGSFSELVNSYNETKDVGKYSVIYTNGNYRDDSIGIDDYDYRVQGMYYMKEKEGRNFGNKLGYSLGFAVSRFDFDDAPKYSDKSKEDVYSARAGVHFMKSIRKEDTLRWISRLEFGYNRHETTRTLELDKVYKNKGSYDSWQVSLDNRLEKTLYRTLSSKVEMYGALNLEYGTFGEFTEKAKADSGVTLEVRGKDYVSVQPEVGVVGEKRFYIGRKISAKVIGSLGLAYELGENYKHNQARVHEGDKGYYDLSEASKEEFYGKGSLGISLERANKYGISFDVETRKHDNKSEMDMRYNARFHYKFRNAR